jgi:ribulose-phosphate 3-epimerase
MQINPAILTDSLATFAQQLALVKQVEEIDTVQVDIIDAIFADNITVNPSDLLDFDFAHLSLDFHLMTEEPMDYVWELIDCGQQLPTQSVIGQIEKMSYQADFLEEIKQAGWQAGLAINLYTPLASIEEAAWQHLDYVLLMAVEAGAQGQLFNSSVFAKIEELKNLIKKNNQEIKISVDGGIKAEHVKSLQTAGADQIAVGSAFFSHDNLNLEFAKFKKELI